MSSYRQDDDSYWANPNRNFSPDAGDPHSRNIVSTDNLYDYEVPLSRRVAESRDSFDYRDPPMRSDAIITDSDLRGHASSNDNGKRDSFYNLRDPSIRDNFNREPPSRGDIGMRDGPYDSRVPLARESSAMETMDIYNSSGPMGRADRASREPYYEDAPARGDPVKGNYDSTVGLTGDDSGTGNYDRERFHLDRGGTQLGEYRRKIDTQYASYESAVPLNREMSDDWENGHRRESPRTGYYQTREGSVSERDRSNVLRDDPRIGNYNQREAMRMEERKESLRAEDREFRGSSFDSRQDSGGEQRMTTDYILKSALRRKNYSSSPVSNVAKLTARNINALDSFSSDNRPLGGSRDFSSDRLESASGDNQFKEFSTDYISRSIDPLDRNDRCPKLNALDRNLDMQYRDDVLDRNIGKDSPSFLDGRSNLASTNNFRSADYQRFSNDASRRDSNSDNMSRFESKSKAIGDYLGMLTTHDDFLLTPFAEADLRRAATNASTENSNKTMPLDTPSSYVGNASFMRAQEMAIRTKEILSKIGGCNSSSANATTSQSVSGQGSEGQNKIREALLRNSLITARFTNKSAGGSVAPSVDKSSTIFNSQTPSAHEGEIMQSRVRDTLLKNSLVAASFSSQPKDDTTSQLIENVGSNMTRNTSGSSADSTQSRVRDALLKNSLVAASFSSQSKAEVINQLTENVSGNMNRNTTGSSADSTQNRVRDALLKNSLVAASFSGQPKADTTQQLKENVGGNMNRNTPGSNADSTQSRVRDALLKNSLVAASFSSQPKANDINHFTENIGSNMNRNVSQSNADSSTQNRVRDALLKNSLVAASFNSQPKVNTIKPDSEDVRNSTNRNTSQSIADSTQNRVKEALLKNSLVAASFISLQSSEANKQSSEKSNITSSKPYQSAQKDDSTQSRVREALLKNNLVAESFSSLSSVKSNEQSGAKYDVSRKQLSKVDYENESISRNRLTAASFFENENRVTGTAGVYSQMSTKEMREENAAPARQQLKEIRSETSKTVPADLTDVLKSIGFNFELSRLMQEKGKAKEDVQKEEQKLEQDKNRMRMLQQITGAQKNKQGDDSQTTTGSHKNTKTSHAFVDLSMSPVDDGNDSRMRSGSQKRAKTSQALDKLSMSPVSDDDGSKLAAHRKRSDRMTEVHQHSVAAASNKRETVQPKVHPGSGHSTDHSVSRRELESQQPYRTVDPVNRNMDSSSILVSPQAFMANRLDAPSKPLEHMVPKTFKSKTFGAPSKPLAPECPQQFLGQFQEPPSFRNVNEKPMFRTIGASSASVLKDKDWDLQTAAFLRSLQGPSTTSETAGGATAAKRSRTDDLVLVTDKMYPQGPLGDRDVEKSKSDRPKNTSRDSSENRDAKRSKIRSRSREKERNNESVVGSVKRNSNDRSRSNDVKQGKNHRDRSKSGDRNRNVDRSRSPEAKKSKDEPRSPVGRKSRKSRSRDRIESTNKDKIEDKNNTVDKSKISAKKDSKEDRKRSKERSRSKNRKRSNEKSPLRRDRSKSKDRSKSQDRTLRSRRDKSKSKDRSKSRDKKREVVDRSENRERRSSKDRSAAVKQPIKVINERVLARKNQSSFKVDRGVITWTQPLQLAEDAKIRKIKNWIQPLQLVEDAKIRKIKNWTQPLQLAEDAKIRKNKNWIQPLQLAEYSKIRKIKKTLPETTYQQRVDGSSMYNCYDRGDHWCDLCNVVCKDLQDLLKHLQSDKHIQGVWEPIQLQQRLKTSSKVAPLGNATKIVSVPCKGAEFLLPSFGFYCSLCQEHSRDQADAQDHVLSNKHYQEYIKYIKINTNYEKAYHKRRVEKTLKRDPTKDSAATSKPAAAGDPELMIPRTVWKPSGGESTSLRKNTSKPTNNAAITSPRCATADVTRPIVSRITVTRNQKKTPNALQVSQTVTGGTVISDSQSTLATCAKESDSDCVIITPSSKESEIMTSATVNIASTSKELQEFTSDTIARVVLDSVATASSDLNEFQKSSGTFDSIDLSKSITAIGDEMPPIVIEPDRNYIFIDQDAPDITGSKSQAIVIDENASESIATGQGKSAENLHVIVDHDVAQRTVTNVAVLPETDQESRPVITAQVISNNMITIQPESTGQKQTSHGNKISPVSSDALEVESLAQLQQGSVANTTVRAILTGYDAVSSDDDSNDTVVASETQRTKDNEITIAKDDRLSKLKDDQVVTEKEDQILVESDEEVLVRNEGRVIVDKENSVIVRNDNQVIVERDDQVIIEKDDQAVVREAVQLIMEKNDRLLVEEEDQMVIEKDDEVKVGENEPLIVERDDQEIVEKEVIAVNDRQMVVVQDNQIMTKKDDIVILNKDSKMIIFEDDPEIGKKINETVALKDVQLIVETDNEMTVENGDQMTANEEDQVIIEKDEQLIEQVIDEIIASKDVQMIVEEDNHMNVETSDAEMENTDNKENTKPVEIVCHEENHENREFVEQVSFEEQDMWETVDEVTDDNDDQDYVAISNEEFHENDNQDNARRKVAEDKNSMTKRVDVTNLEITYDRQSENENLILENEEQGEIVILEKEMTRNILRDYGKNQSNEIEANSTQVMMEILADDSVTEIIQDEEQLSVNSSFENGENIPFSKHTDNLEIFNKSDEKISDEVEKDKQTEISKDLNKEISASEDTEKAIVSRSAIEITEEECTASVDCSLMQSGADKFVKKGKNTTTEVVKQTEQLPETETLAERKEDHRADDANSSPLVLSTGDLESVGAEKSLRDVLIRLEDQANTEQSLVPDETDVVNVANKSREDVSRIGDGGTLEVIGRVENDDAVMDTENDIRDHENIVVKSENSNCPIVAAVHDDENAYVVCISDDEGESENARRDVEVMERIEDNEQNTEEMEDMEDMVDSV